MNYRGGKELKAGLESLATVEVEMMRRELNIYFVSKSIATWSRTVGGKIKRHSRGRLDRPRHPCHYGEKSKMASIKRVNN